VRRSASGNAPGRSRRGSSRVHAERRCHIAIEGQGETVHWELAIFEDAKSKDILRVVSYGDAPAVLEKRHFYLDGASGMWKHGKIRGMTGLDFGRAVQLMPEFWPMLSRGWESAKTPEAVPPQTPEQERAIRGGR
jgi:hypothetical protein